MRRYEAPAKVNLSLHVEPPDQGYHPLFSLVQTIEWCDLLGVEPSEDLSLSVTGLDIEPEENLVTRAFGLAGIDRVSLSLEKRIPVAAGLGGGSADAAAALIAAADHGRLDRDLIVGLAPELGADVSLFLRGGTQMMTGRGEKLEVLPRLAGFAVAVVVPSFEMSTSEVYRRWDLMEGPQGEAVETDELPPSLRDGMPLRNDLLPAAISLRPELGDFMADIRSIWGVPVFLTGSGPASFGLFPDVSEAADAAAAIAGTRAAVGVTLRDHGVAERS